MMHSPIYIRFISKCLVAEYCNNNPVLIICYVRTLILPALYIGGVVAYWHCVMYPVQLIKQISDAVYVF